MYMATTPGRRTGEEAVASARLRTTQSAMAATATARLTATTTREARLTGTITEADARDATRATAAPHGWVTRVSRGCSLLCAMRSASHRGMVPNTHAWLLFAGVVTTAVVRRPAMKTKSATESDGCQVLVGEALHAVGLMAAMTGTGPLGAYQTHGHGCSNEVPPVCVALTLVDAAALLPSLCVPRCPRGTSASA